MSIKSKLIGGFALCIISIIILCVVNYQSTAMCLAARRSVSHTQKVLERLEYVISLCKDLETGQRGYALTGDEDFLAPYHSANARITGALAEIRSLTSDNPIQMSRLEKIQELQAAKAEFCKKVVDATKSGGLETARKITATKEGKKIMDSLRSAVDQMQGEERALLDKRIADSDRALNFSSTITYLGAGFALVISSLAALTVTTAFSRSIKKVQLALDKISKGEFDSRISIDSKDEFSNIGLAFNNMAAELSRSTTESKNQSWLNSSINRLLGSLQGERDIQSSAQKVLSEFASTLGTRHGMFYFLSGSRQDARKLNLLASYAHNERKELANSFDIGQGLIGQCALEKQMILVRSLPDDYVKISSGTGNAAPKVSVVIPVMFENEIKAVIEQASFEELDDVQMKYLEQCAISLGVVINSIEASVKADELLRQEQALTEELQSQQEELTEANKKMETLMFSLQSSEEELRQQQEELQQTNEELEERGRVQSRQNAELENKNLELEKLRLTMQAKARELSVASKYKSEFLSNMSHELRTPLNSLLILSRTLAENREGNLTEKQIEFAKTIHSAGSDLLSLIDDVLDISKIEAGAMPIDISEESPRELCNHIMSSLNALAVEKELKLMLELDNQLPRFIKTDGRRVQQVLKNIVANAIKFTKHGSVTLHVSPVSRGWSPDNESLNEASAVIAFECRDTGIGIAEDKMDVIFEAFRQADGTTHRRFGGTGLGLAISKEIVRLLGGEIRLQSELGMGSTFTVFLPLEYARQSSMKSLPEIDHASSVSCSDFVDTSGEPNLTHETELADDRAALLPNDKVLLVVHQDRNSFHRIKQLANDRGFKVLYVSQGKLAFSAVQKYKPDAVMVSVNLPEKDGWTFLDRLKRDLSTRHIPLLTISDQEVEQQVRRIGALGVLTEPISQTDLNQTLNQLKEFLSQAQRKLLIVEDDDNERKKIEDLLSGEDVDIKSVSNGSAALSLLKEKRFDCMILDLGLPDMNGLELLSHVQSDSKQSNMRVIVHTGRQLNQQEEFALRRHSEAIVLKGSRSAERLLDEATLFLHRIEANIPEEKRRTLRELHLKDELLCDRKILIADDDMRHIFALTNLLERYQVKVLYADTGKVALDVLEKNPDLDLVLMDVMMPEMDGLEAIKVIRDQARYRKLPIIALTAKAMKGDREDCIAAGASDYLSKPIDSDQLLSLIRVWLY